MRFIPDIIFDIVYIAGYIWWSRAYYRHIDPGLRRALTQRFGVPIGWIYRKGSLYRSPLSFQLPYSTWSWGIAEQRGSMQDGLVYILYLLAVPVLGGLWPVAVLFIVVILLHAIQPLIAYPLFFLTIPIYSLWWSGYYRPPIVESADG